MFLLAADLLLWGRVADTNCKQNYTCSVQRPHKVCLEYSQHPSKVQRNLVQRHRLEIDMADILSLRQLSYWYFSYYFVKLKLLFLEIGISHTNNSNFCYWGARNIQMLSCFWFYKSIRYWDLHVRKGHGTGLNKVHKEWCIEIVGNTIELKLKDSMI